MTGSIMFNGKFLMAPPTGVHRVAEELIGALDELASEDASIAERFNLQVFAPRRLHHVLNLKNIRFNKGVFLAGFHGSRSTCLGLLVRQK